MKMLFMMHSKTVHLVVQHWMYLKKNLLLELSWQN